MMGGTNYAKLFLSKKPKVKVRGDSLPTKEEVRRIGRRKGRKFLDGLTKKKYRAQFQRKVVSRSKSGKYCPIHQEAPDAAGLNQCCIEAFGR